MHHRRGLTLMEVLISIGIVTIGIFGLLALLPIAGRQAERALINDHKSAAGQNAVAEFFARGMHRNDMWMVPNGSGTSNTQFNPTAGISFCIDPQIAARHGDPMTGAPPFPTAPGLMMSNAMRRINVRRQLTQREMNQAMADFVCTAADDLTIDKGVDTGDPPVQEMVKDGATPPNPVLRQTDGRYSWMATLVPKFGSADDYILSIVVFYNRDLSHPNTPPASADFQAPERVATVADPADLYNIGIGGGDMRITMRSGGQPNDLDVRKGEWVMLAVPPGAGSYFRWYRVVDADAENDVNGSGTPTRVITLEGPDWPYNSMNPPQYTPWVIMPTGVVAVYERTVRMEEGGLWAEW